MRHFFTTLIFISILGIQPNLAANDNYAFGGRGAGMGNATVTLYDFWALSHNQAGLARLPHMAAGIYLENRFLLQELSFGAAGFALPVNTGVFGLSFTHFGYALYNESKLGLAYARDFGERLSVGLQLNYLNTSIAEEYGSKGNVAVELGFIYQVMPQLSIATHIFNPTRAKIHDYADERIPTILRAGLAYQFSDKVILAVETEKSVDRDPVFKVGMEYHITDPLYLRAGLGTNPASNAFGFGLALGSIHIDVATTYHHVLGYSPQLSFIYHFK